MLAAARAGQARCALLVAEPGLGKTALLDDLAEAADDCLVLRTAGVRSESSLPYAALHRLLRPVLDHRRKLPAAQAGALSGQLGLGGDPDNDRFLLCVAVLSLLATVSADSPVLCCVDDAQWLDGPSLEALGFAARRLHDERVCVLFASREPYGDEPHGSLLPDIPVLPLRELTDEAIRDLIDARAPTGLAEPARAAIIRTAAGNPLAASEILESLSPAQRSGSAPAPDGLPPDSGLLSAYRDRIVGLPSATRRLLLLAAADQDADVDLLGRAAGAERLDVTALEPAEQAGLIQIQGTAVRFSHPLVRSAAYQGAPLARRRTAHDTLARVLDPERERARRVWHRAAATWGPSDKLARELDAAALADRRQGRYTASSLAFERAAQLTSAGAARAARLIAGARDAWRAGRPDRARALLRQAQPIAGDAESHGRAELLRGDIELREGDAVDAGRALLEAADTLLAGDRTLAVRALMRAGQASLFAGDLDTHAVIGHLARRLRRPDDPAEIALIVEYLTGTVAAANGDHPAAATSLARAVDLGQVVGDSSALTWASIAALLAGDTATAQTMATRAVAMARGRGAVASVPHALEALVYAELCTAQYLSAWPHALEGFRLAKETGQDNCATHHLTGLALLAAAAGDEPACREYAHTAAAKAATNGLGLAAALSGWAEAFLDLSAGRPADAVVRFRSLSRLGVGRGHFIVRLLTTAHFVEAAVQAGDRTGTVAALAAYDRFASSTGNANWLALAERARGLLADGPAAIEHFRAALRLHAAGSCDFERARTQLMLGGALRRQRRPSQAREPLREALETFQRFGTRLWEARAGAELRATGTRLDGGDRSRVDELTPQQRQIAEFVAQGRTNREVAAELFVSPRTVDHHLRNIFAKLGIRSRFELARLIDPAPATSGPDAGRLTAHGLDERDPR